MKVKISKDLFLVLMIILIILISVFDVLNIVYPEKYQETKIGTILEYNTEKDAMKSMPMIYRPVMNSKTIIAEAPEPISYTTQDELEQELAPENGVDNIVESENDTTEPTVSTEPTVAPESTESASSVPTEDAELLAIAIYQEAGGNNVCDECRYMVGDVILNRVADSRFPNTIRGVLEQYLQYGRFCWTGVVWPSEAYSDSEADAVQRARDVAIDLLSNIRHSELYGNGYIWQAEFPQGNDNIIHCGIYFGR